MSRAELAIYDELRPGVLSKSKGAAFRTRTRADTGSWFGKSRVLACRVDDELVLFAAGKRPFVEKIPLASLGESFYNHVTGEVALGPAEGARVKALRLPPLEGYELLEELDVGA